ncbi:MAG: hypothetical protein AB4038_13715 [Prochloraceae cyanobacterium]
MIKDNLVYQELAKILDIRQQNIVLRRGRKYLREISVPNDGVNFSLPEKVGRETRFSGALVADFQHKRDAVAN